MSVCTQAEGKGNLNSGKCGSDESFTPLSRQAWELGQLE